MPFIGGLPEDVIHPMSPGFSKIYQLLTLVEGGARAAITQYADLEAERRSVSAWEGKVVALFLNSHELMLAALALRSEIEAFARSKAPSFERSVQVASDSFDSVSFFKDFRVCANAPEAGCNPVEFSNGISLTSFGAVRSPDVPVGIPFHDSSSTDSGQVLDTPDVQPSVEGATDIEASASTEADVGDEVPQGVTSGEPLNSGLSEHLARFESLLNSFGTHIDQLVCRTCRSCRHNRFPEDRTDACECCFDFASTFCRHSRSSNSGCADDLVGEGFGSGEVRSFSRDDLTELINKIFNMGPEYLSQISDASELRANFIKGVLDSFYLIGGK